jgi:serine protease AprX
MDRGWGRPSSYLECFQWFLAPTDLNDENPDPDRAPHVINNSWYCSFEEGCTSLAVDSMLMQGVTNLKASGVVVVVSAGNNGPGCSTVGNPPAYFEQSFSVGSTRIDDTVSAFSSRGPVLVDGSFRAKPNVAAPGSNIRSSTPNGGYANFSGTSMAGPHVAGLVALMLSARPDLAGQVELIESIVEQTAVPKTDTSHCGGIPGSQRPNYAYGYGRVDALSAVEEILTATPDFTPGQTIAVHVFPNPLRDRVYFDLNHPGGRMRLEIFHSDGRRVYERDWQSAGRETVDVRLPNQPPGVYFWQMRGESGRADGKLIVE